MGATHADKTNQPKITWLQIESPSQSQNKPITKTSKPFKKAPIQHKNAKLTEKKPKQTKEKTITQHQEQALPQTSKSSLINNKPAIQQGLLQQQKLQYLALIMRHIEQHKRYPKAARRRGIEGLVSVSFMIYANGSIHQIKIQQGAKILQKSVRKSLAKASPLPIPKNTLPFPIPCHFTMQFHLQS